MHNNQALMNSLLVMISSKRHLLFLAVNAFLIFANFHLWSYAPDDSGQGDTREIQLGSSRHYEVRNHIMQNARDTVDPILSPAKISDYKSKKGNLDVSHANKQVITANPGNEANIWRQRHNTTFAKPQTDSYEIPKGVHPTIKDLPEVDYTQLRKAYVVPSIEQTSLVNCAKLLANDSSEISRAEQTLLQRPKVPIYEETYQEWFKDCANYRRMRGFVEIPLTPEEEEVPLAFSIAMYTDVEATERLLRAIYRPHNYYCIHVDIKSSLLVHRTMRALATCFDNVWVASHLDKIKWGDVSVLLPEINCMRDLMKHYKKAKWKYFINLTGQEFPLRTNYELARIAKIFNGSNDIGGSLSRMDPDRVRYKWTHRWSKTYQQTIFYNTFMPKDPPPYNLTFYKGELHGMFSRGMVEFLVENEIAQKYLAWCWDTGHPSEHYWNVLNYNRHIGAPGGYQGPSSLADAYSQRQISRVKQWSGLYDNRTCNGKVVRGICVYGIKDAPWLATRPELFANKFHLTYQYLAYDCLEELHRNRTKLKDKLPFNETAYKELPTVKYSRKDGW